MRDPVIKLDSFFTDTRMYMCRNWKCKQNTVHQETIPGECKLKRIDLDRYGKCQLFEPWMKDEESE